jgi:hypothetical protein
MKYRIIEKDLLERFLNPSVQRASIMRIVWTSRKPYYLSTTDYEIDDIKDICESDLYWCNDSHTIDKINPCYNDGYLLKHENEYYLFYPEHEEDDIEGLETQLYDLINGDDQLDVFTALTFLTL